MSANFGHRNCEGPRRFVTALLLCLVTALAHADDGPADPRSSERGLPTVTVVPPGHLGAPQVFAVSVAGRRLYVGTLTGLAIHDGLVPFHTVQIQDFAEAVLTGREPLVTGAQARTSLAVIEGIYTSSRTGTVVDLRDPAV